MSIKFFKLFIFYFYIFSIDCYVVIPLKIYDNKFIQKIISSENLDENALSLILYDQISLGDPQQNIIFIISPDEYNFYMITNRNNNKTNYSYYDFRISKTNNIDFGDNNMNTNVVFMSEKFYFENNYDNQNFPKEIGIENINLVLYLQKPNFIRNYNLSSNINSYIIFGLKLTESFDRVEYSLNLIRQLKRKNITKNYKWFIYYNATSNTKINTESNYFNGIKMIIGAEPHEIYPNQFQEKNLKLINSKAHNGYVNWGFYFNKIYYYQNNESKDKILFDLNNDINNNTKIEDYLIADIKHDLIFINSPRIFFDSINKNIFNNLFEEHNCFMKGNSYKYIYCDNKLEIEEYLENNFKDIYLKNQELNYEFVLRYQDLFIKYKDKILFLIISSNESKKWILGIPFLRKYLLTYDYAHKVIGFYKEKKLKYLIKEDDFKNNIIKIILIILLLLIFGSLGFLVSKHIYGYNRKKRLNEIQENYNYEEKVIENIKNKENKEKLIELKIEK